MYASNCSRCERKGVGRIVKNIFTPKEFYDLLGELITRVSISIGIPVGVSILIKDFVFDIPDSYIILDWMAFRRYRRWDPERFNNIFTETICIDCHQHPARGKYKTEKVKLSLQKNIWCEVFYWYISESLITKVRSGSIHEEVVEEMGVFLNIWKDAMECTSHAFFHALSCGVKFIFGLCQRMWSSIIGTTIGSVLRGLTVVMLLCCYVVMLLWIFNFNFLLINKEWLIWIQIYRYEKIWIKVFHTRWLKNK